MRARPKIEDYYEPSNRLVSWDEMEAYNEALEEWADEAEDTIQEWKLLYNKETQRRINADGYVRELKMAMLTAIKMIDENHSNDE